MTMTWQPPKLDDLRDRRLRYVRISVTERCQFRCPYCRPEQGDTPCGPQADYLTAGEIARVVKVLTTIGIKTVRFTGGEPLLRRDLASIVQAVHAVGVDDMAITTNAALLTPKRARDLSDAGLQRINISLDTLDPERFRRLSGGAPIEPVLSGIKAVCDVGIQLKTNTVVVRGQNESELEQIAQYVWSLGGIPRFIEVMPMGAGKDLSMVPADEIMKSFDLTPEHPKAVGQKGIGPADYWIHQGQKNQIVGVIAATTRNFCSSCNRIRITATGSVRPCLASACGTELRPLLRDPQTHDEDIVQAIYAALAIKPDGHRFSEGIAGELPMRSLGG